jgi:hypothetical protein
MPAFHSSVAVTLPEGVPPAIAKADVLVPAPES